MRPQKVIYHLVPKTIHGNVLYPLNALHDIVPEIAEKAAQKYKGREAIQKRHIPFLDCLWGDVLMFCPVHPSLIMATFREEGYELKARKWFQIPLDRLQPQNSVTYLPRKREFGDFSVDRSDFVPLAECDFDAFTHLLEPLREHIHSARSENRMPFMFGGVPHILYKGIIELDSVDIVEF